MKTNNFILILVIIGVLAICPLAQSAETKSTEVILTFKNPFQPAFTPKAKTPRIEPQQESRKPIVQEQAITLPPQLKVHGIVWGSARPQAIINNKVVDIGDTINEIKIINIASNGIDVLYKGKNFTIGYNN